jgi:hypothetical protein
MSIATMIDYLKVTQGNSDYTTNGFRATHSLGTPPIPIFFFFFFFFFLRNTKRVVDFQVVRLDRIAWVTLGYLGIQRDGGDSLEWMMNGSGAGRS